MDLKLRDDDGRMRYWWSMLNAVPSSRKCWEYRRLWRAWFDHTWSNHPFLTHGSEMHLTVSLFENFTIFDHAVWLPRLLHTAGLAVLDRPIDAANWGYEILDAPSNKLADIAVHYRADTTDGVIVIEAKKRRGALKPSDRDPASYLDLDAFAWAPRRQLIYLVDESDRGAVESVVDDPAKRSGILTWQELGGLQVALASTLRIDGALRAFVAGAIQNQFLAADIVPTTLCADYLPDEPVREVINSQHPEKMTMQHWTSQEWRLSAPLPTPNPPTEAPPAESS